MPEKLISGPDKRIIVEKLFADFPDSFGLSVDELRYVCSEIRGGKVFQEDGRSTVSPLVNVSEEKLGVWRIGF